MPRPRNWGLVPVTTVILIGVPGVALACPVCFGASDSPMAAGVNAGIYVLLAVTSVVLAGLGLVALRVARSQAAASRGEPDGPTLEGGRELCRAASSHREPVARPAAAKTAAGARRTC